MTQDEVEAVCRSSKKAVIERAMGGEMTHHLGYSPGGAKPAEQANHRNGTTGTTVITDDGPVRINDDPSVPAFTPTLAVLPDGAIGVAYYDFRQAGSASFQPTELWLATSRAAGHQTRTGAMQGRA